MGILKGILGIATAWAAISFGGIIGGIVWFIAIFLLFVWGDEWFA